jgi:hypothetical protein
MSSYKTRARDKGNINNDYVKATRAGTTIVNGSSLSASNLQANMPIKTDNALILQSTKLDIADTNGLQSALDSAVQYQGTLPAPIGALVKISDTTGNVENSNITEADVNNKVNKSGDTMTGNLNLGSNDIDSVGNIEVATIDGIQLISGTTIQDLVLNNGGGNNIKITNCNLDLNNNNIQNVDSIQLNSISATTTDININNRLLVNGNDILDVDLLEINKLGKNGAGDISLQSNIDVNNQDLKFVSNIDATDVKTTTLTAYAPLTEIKLNTNTDLNLNGNNIIGLDLINGIQPSGGLYSESSGFSTSSTTEVNILGQGASSGSLSIPADTFTALSMYSFKASGVLSGGTNDVFTIRAKTLSPGPISVILGEIMPTLQDNNLIDVAWDIMIDFTIRAIGISNTASLVLSGAFRYTNNSDVVRTFLRTIVLNTGFDTTRDNTLELTFQNDATNPITNFRIDQASFTKWY